MTGTGALNATRLIAHAGGRPAILWMAGRRWVTWRYGRPVATSPEYEAWLAARVRRDPWSASEFYAAYRAWSGGVERRAKQRKLLVRRLEKYQLLPGHLGAAFLALNDAFAAFSLRVELSFKRFARRGFQGRQHHALKNVGERQVLRHCGFKGFIKGHAVSPEVAEPTGEAESAGRETVSPTTSPEARP